MVTPASTVQVTEQNYDRGQQAPEMSQPVTDPLSSKNEKILSSEWIESKPTMETTTTVSEKQSSTTDVLQNEGVVSRNWSHKEEKKLKFKLDFIVLLLLMAGLFSLQLDKGNISYANTTTFAEDIGISPNEINWGIAIQLAAIVIFEIPFNMILSRIGPSLWLTIQIFAWSIISTCQAALSNRAGWYASRFLLGMWEAGYLAASLTILASFYTRKEMAMRISLVYIGNYFAQGVGALLAAAIFTIPDGTSGLLQWQWLFIINGVIGFVVGVLFVLFLPRSNLNTLPLANIKAFDAFNKEERYILDGRVLLDDPRKQVRLTGIGFKRALRLLVDWRIWGHFAINVICITPKGGLAVYSPSIIKNLGFDTVKANALASVGSYGACVLSLITSWVSDKYGFRGPVCIACNSFAMLFAGLQYGYVHSDNQWLKYAIFVLLYSGNSISQSINDAWLSSNIDNAQARCVGLALAVAGSNLGGIIGQYLFLENDAPYYPHGFLKILCIYAGGIGLIVVILCIYIWQNKRMKAQHGSGDLIDGQGVTTTSAEDAYAKVKNQL